MYNNHTAGRIFTTGSLKNTDYEKYTLLIMYRNHILSRMFG